MLVRTRRTDTVRRAFAHYWEGDVDAVVALYHQGIELWTPGLMGRPATSVAGVAALRAYLGGLVADGMNHGVDGLEVVEFEGRVLASGRLAAPAGNDLHWTFEFADDRIRRIRLREEIGWAALGDREFALAQVADVPTGGAVTLRLGDGRALTAPVDADLAELVAPQTPALVYFDADGLAGWYLPDHQRGVALR